jgi:hypothetical protein
MEENINQIFELKEQSCSNGEINKPVIQDSYVKGFVINLALSISMAILFVTVLFLYYQDKASTSYGFGAIGIALAFIAFSITTVICLSFIISMINMIIFSRKKYYKAASANLIILVITIIGAFIIISILKIKYGISFWGL